MDSDFGSARAHLEQAFEYLSGDDRVSLAARELIGGLIDALISAELAQPTARVIPFPDRQHRRQLIG